MFSSKVFDESALSQRCKEEMYKCYPDAKRAHLKSGGNFPYLSRSNEVNLMIQVCTCAGSWCNIFHNFFSVTIERFTLNAIVLLIQIHLMTFQGTRYCAKDPSLVSADEIKAARGELDPPSSGTKAALS